jgi:hypothetical protein
MLLERHYTNGSKHLLQPTGIRRHLIRPHPFGSYTSIAMPTKVFPY